MPLTAQEYVSVGPAFGGWQAFAEETRLVSVSRDSIWMWDVRANANVVPGLVERGGSVQFTGSEGLIDSLALAMALFDGDGSTYFNPDEHPEIERDGALFIDLGTPMQINRIRFHPRLDRDNRNRFLQAFDVLDGGLRRVFGYAAPNENTVPVVDRAFSSRRVQTLVLQPAPGRAWEIAELEVYSDGTVPTGSYTSVPLSARQQAPVWGRVTYEGGDIVEAEAVVQTRTGPDPNPELYYLKKGDRLSPTNRASWEGALESLKAPPVPNPDWSPWETLGDGLVRSPALNRYLQFRVFLPQPGTSLQQLRFEYSYPPIARDLAAEITPLIAEPGRETAFSIFLEVHLQTAGREGVRDTGFRQLQVATAAEIGAVTRVLVDDEEVFTTTTYQAGEGFIVNLWRHVTQNGSFVQLDFTAKVLREQTRFEVRAIDRRSTDKGLTSAYQVARAADVDGETPGGELLVRLSGAERGLPLIANVDAGRVFSPNGDHVNDDFELRFVLLKLVEPVTATLDIVSLDGRRVRRAHVGRHANGTVTVFWDGRDDGNRPVPPGLYVYCLEVAADKGRERHTGTVGVAY